MKSPYLSIHYPVLNHKNHDDYDFSHLIAHPVEYKQHSTFSTFRGSGVIRYTDENSSRADDKDLDFIDNYHQSEHFYTECLKIIVNIKHLAPNKGVFTIVS